MDELRLEDLEIQEGSKMNEEGIYIEILKDGPYILHGDVELVQHFIMSDDEKIPVYYKKGEKYAAAGTTPLCRCGLSKKMPYCDGNHQKASEKGIDLTSTATFDASLDTANIIEGPEVVLADDEKLCVLARFCHQKRGIWDEVREGGGNSAMDAVNMAHQCPAGRLIVMDKKTGKKLEPRQMEVEIGLIEDPDINCSGPIYLKGGIPVRHEDGKYYEVRFRQTLCRCGQSDNKPFCDGKHAKDATLFQDGLPTEPDPDGEEFKK